MLSRDSVAMPVSPAGAEVRSGPKKPSDRQGVSYQAFFQNDKLSLSLWSTLPHHVLLARFDLPPCSVFFLNLRWDKALAGNFPVNVENFYS